MSRNPFRYTITHNRADAAARLHHRHRRARRSASATRASQLDLESPDIYQYNLTLERELPGDIGARVSYIGSTMRKLLVHAGLQHACRRARCRSATSTRIPRRTARLPFPLYGTFMDITENTGEGQFNALQLELQRRFQARLRAQRRLHARRFRQQRAGQRQQHDRRRPVRPVRHREGSRARSERRQAPGRDEQHVGHPGRPRAQRTAATCRAGPTRSSAAGPCRRSSRRAPDRNLTPFFVYGTDPIYPANTGRALDGVGQFGEAWRPDVTGNPNIGGTPRAVLRRHGVHAAGAGHARQREEGQPRRARARGSSTSRSTRTSSARTASRVEFTALLDNAFNHPQFFVRAGHRRVHGPHRLPAERRARQRHDRGARRRHRRATPKASRSDASSGWACGCGSEWLTISSR